MKTILSVVLATGCGAALAVAPAAQAADPVKTKVTFDQGFSYDDDTDTVTMTGSVSSPRDRCATDRKVIVTATDSGTRAGVDRTNSKGIWKVTFIGDDVDPGDGNFKAVAPKVKVGKTTCARGRGTQNINDEAPRRSF